MRTEGVRGLFRGLGPTVLINAPYSGLYYMFYTRLKEALAEEGRPQAAINFASGVVAAVAATLLTQPADVVRTRMQLGFTSAAGSAAGPAAGGSWGTLVAAVRQQGPSALLI
ncbi:Solute carrier family 25 member 38, partial [Tetrabaena socialis]